MAEVYETLAPPPAALAAPGPPPEAQLPAAPAEPATALHNTDLRSPNGNGNNKSNRSTNTGSTAVEDPLLAAKHNTRQKAKDTPSTNRKTTSSKTKKKSAKGKGGKKKGKREQEEKQEPRNWWRIACMVVSAVFLVIFIGGALTAVAAIAYKW